MNKRSIMALIVAVALPPMAVGIVVGCLGPNTEISPDVAALMLKVEEQNNTLASIESTVGANSDVSVFVIVAGVIGAILAAGSIVDRRYYHSARKRREASAQSCQP